MVDKHPLMELRRDILQEATTGPVAHRAGGKGPKDAPRIFFAEHTWPLASTASDPTHPKILLQTLPEKRTSAVEVEAAGSEQILVCDCNTSFRIFFS